MGLITKIFAGIGILFILIYFGFFYVHYIEKKIVGCEDVESSRYYLYFDNFEGNVNWFEEDYYEYGDKKTNSGNFKYKLTFRNYYPQKIDNLEYFDCNDRERVISCLCELHNKKCNTIFTWLWNGKFWYSPHFETRVMGDGAEINSKKN